MKTHMDLAQVKTTIRGENGGLDVRNISRLSSSLLNFSREQEY